MTLPLRVLHRRAWTVLACVLPVGLAAAVAARREVPPTGPLPRPIAAAAPASGEVVARRDWPGTGIQLILRAGEPPTVELRPARDLALPALLVYWAGPAAPPARLPDRAFLLGSLSGVETRRFALPEVARGVAGRLYLYSLGHGEPVASIELDERGGRP